MPTIFLFVDVREVMNDAVEICKKSVLIEVKEVEDSQILDCVMVKKEVGKLQINLKGLPSYSGNNNKIQCKFSRKILLIKG